jgi:predicted ester cyclase
MIFFTYEQNLSKTKDGGCEEYKEAFRTLRRAFPDAEWTLQDLLSDWDKVIVRWSFLGTHEGQFFNLPQNSKEVTYPILARY